MAKSTQPVARLLWLTENGQQELLLHPEDSITIGRGDANTIVINSARVSRNHARLIRTRRGVYLQDDNSSVGTFLNGERIQPGVPVQLKSGDIIQLGYYQVFEFRA